MVGARGPGRAGVPRPPPRGGGGGHRPPTGGADRQRRRARAPPATGAAHRAVGPGSPPAADGEQQESDEEQEEQEAEAGDPAPEVDGPAGGADVGRDARLEADGSRDEGDDAGEQDSDQSAHVRISDVVLARWFRVVNCLTGTTIAVGCAEDVRMPSRFRGRAGGSMSRVESWGGTARPGRRAGGVLIGGRAARDLMAEAFGEGAAMVAIPVGRLEPAFFDLRSGFAGDILQVSVTYRTRLAIVGELPEPAASSECVRGPRPRVQRGDTALVRGVTRRAARAARRLGAQDHRLPRDAGVADADAVTVPSANSNTAMLWGGHHCGSAGSAGPSRDRRGRPRDGGSPGRRPRDRGHGDRDDRMARPSSSSRSASKKLTSGPISHPSMTGAAGSRRRPQAATLSARKAREMAGQPAVHGS